MVRAVREGEIEGSPPKKTERGTIGLFTNFAKHGLGKVPLRCIQHPFPHISPNSLRFSAVVAQHLPLIWRTSSRFFQCFLATLLPI